MPTTHDADLVRLLHHKHRERIEKTLAVARECSAEDPRALTYLTDVSALLSHIAAQDQRHAALVAEIERAKGIMASGLGRADCYCCALRHEIQDFLGLPRD